MIETNKIELYFRYEKYRGNNKNYKLSNCSICHNRFTTIDESGPKNTLYLCSVKCSKSYLKAMNYYTFIEPIEDVWTLE